MPPDEDSRLATLEQYGVLDTPPEEAFDAIATLAAQVCATPIALVTLVDRSRQWFKARVGLDRPETPREESFCAHAICEPEPFIVRDARADPRFADNPLVTDDPNIRFYAGCQLVAPDGARLGTLCVIDRKPRDLDSAQLRALATLARQVTVELELRRHLCELAHRSSASADLTRLLVHDLKSPLAAVLASADFLLEHGELGREAREVVGDMRLGAEAIHELMLDLLDVARAEHVALVARPREVDAAALLEHAARNARSRATARGVRVATHVAPGAERVTADAQLMRRVLRNLTDNALWYAPRGTEVRLAARPVAGGVEVRVCDEGPGVPAAFRAAIFERYVRLDAGAAARTGHGLGLVFCRLAVEAHGGSIRVEDNAPRGSRFCVVLPSTRESKAD